MKILVQSEDTNIKIYVPMFILTSGLRFSKFITKEYSKHSKINKSKKELLHELSMKGIDSGALKADEFLMDSIDDKASIRNIINKRWKALDLVDLKEKERMTRYLARHGFAASDVFSVYKELGI